MGRSQEVKLKEKDGEIRMLNEEVERIKKEAVAQGAKISSIVLVVGCRTRTTKSIYRV